MKKSYPKHMQLKEMYELSQWKNTLKPIQKQLY